MHTQINDTSHLEDICEIYMDQYICMHTCTRAHTSCKHDIHALRFRAYNICTRIVVELSHAAQARTHTRARTGCTCPVFIEAPVFQQERAAAHHQCHHQCSRSRSLSQLTPHLNLQLSTSTLHVKPLCVCSGAIHRRAHPRRLSHDAPSCGYVRTIYSQRPTWPSLGASHASRPIVSRASGT
jgi:hypothetical protein